MPAPGPPREPALRRLLFRVGFDHSSGPRLLRPTRVLAWMAFCTMLVVQNRAARGRRARAAVTYWWCQASRARGRSFLVQFPTNQLRVPSWSSLGAIVAATGSHEYVEEQFVRDLLRPGDVVVDVGANIGFYTIPIAASGCSVWSFEPDARAASALVENVELNAVGGRTKVERIALSDFDGRAKFTSDLDVMNHLVPDDARGAGLAEVDVRRLDSLASSPPFQLDRLALIKVDAEGHDEAVLRGAVRTIGAFRPTVLAETNLGGLDLRAFLRDLGYEWFWYEPDTRVLQPIPDGWPGNFGFHTNLFAVHAERLAEVTERLTGAVRTDRSPPDVRIAASGR